MLAFIVFIIIIIVQLLTVPSVHCAGQMCFRRRRTNVFYHRKKTMVSLKPGVKICARETHVFIEFAKIAADRESAKCKIKPKVVP